MHQPVKGLLGLAACCLVLGGSLVVGLARYDKVRKAMMETKLPVIEVWLMDSTDRVKGRPWPTYDDGRPLEITAVEEPFELVLHLPSGREIRMRAKAATFEQDNGVVSQVSPLPLMGLVEFRDAVAEAKRIAADLRVDTDPQLRARLMEWQGQNPEADMFSNPVYMARAQLETGVLLYIEIKPHPNGDGWYVIVDFTRPASGE